MCSSSSWPTLIFLHWPWKFFSLELDPHVSFCRFLEFFCEYSNKIFLTKSLHLPTYSYIFDNVTRTTRFFFIWPYNAGVIMVMKNQHYSEIMINYCEYLQSLKFHFLISLRIYICSIYLFTKNHIYSKFTALLRRQDQILIFWVKNINNITKIVDV